ncbi:MAG: GNAT family N-acetyltransferase [Pseudomonadota bacterium]
MRLGSHRKGVGGALISAMAVAAKAAGYHKLTARIRADNAHGLGYYAKNGFQEVGALREHIRTPSGFVAQVLMERML